MIYIKGGKNGVPCPLMDEGTSVSQTGTERHGPLAVICSSHPKPVQTAQRTSATGSQQTSNCTKPLGRQFIVLKLFP